MPLEGIALFALTLGRMVVADVWDDDARFGVMLLVAIVFYVAVALDAVLRENKYELMSFLVINALVCALWCEFLFLFFCDSKKNI